MATASSATAWAASKAPCSVKTERLPPQITLESGDVVVQRGGRLVVIAERVMDLAEAEIRGDRLGEVAEVGGHRAVTGGQHERALVDAAPP